MVAMPLSNKIKFKIFDKKFEKSNGIYGLHRFKDDEQQNMVRNNYRAVLEELQADNLLIIRHVHGNAVIDADRVLDFSKESEADGAVTSKPGLVIAIQSADCVPILLASDDGQVIGGAHCGWRSAVANVLGNVVQVMREKGAKGITAIIGPAIHQQFYEVDQPFYDIILGIDGDAQKLFIQSTNSGRYLFDLPAFVKMRLNSLGIDNIIDMCEDTYSNEDRFHSYRRDVQRDLLDEQTNTLSTILIC